MAKKREREKGNSGMVKNTCFDTFFDAGDSVADVCKCVSKRVKKVCVSKNVAQRLRVKNQKLVKTHILRVKTCQNVSKIHTVKSVAACNITLQILDYSL